MTEGQFSKFKATAKDKIPEIKRSVDLIDHLKRNQGKVQSSKLLNKLIGIDKAIETKFQLSDGLYTVAEIPEGIDRVGLWLGADVMVEYSLAEAEKLLKTNLDRAEQNIGTYVSLNCSNSLRTLIWPI